MGQESHQEGSTNLFKIWIDVINDVLFRTRSPFPDRDHYLSPNALPACSNSSIQVENPNDSAIKKYLKEQIAILKFNNPKFTHSHIQSAISSRLIHWPGNTTIKEQSRELNISELIHEVFAMEDYKELIDFRFLHHWYSDEIESLPSHQFGEKWGEKTRAKQKARKSNKIDAILEDINEVSLGYKEEFGVFPTVDYLIRATDYNDYTIRSYAKGYFSKQSEHSLKITRHFLNSYPDLTHEELAKKTGISIRTIRRYSKLS